MAFAIASASAFVSPFSIVTHGLQAKSIKVEQET